MMITLRMCVVAVPPCHRILVGPSEVQDGGQLGEVADLVGRRRDPWRQRLLVPVDPGGIHPELLGAEHVHVRAIADEQRLLWAYAQTHERGIEDVAPRLAPADLVRHDDGVEQLYNARALENIERRR